MKLIKRVMTFVRRQKPLETVIVSLGRVLGPLPDETYICLSHSLPFEGRGGKGGEENMKPALPEQNKEQNVDLKADRLLPVYQGSCFCPRALHLVF